MKTCLSRLVICLSVLLAVAARADGLPYFSNLRAEVANQLTIASNSLPASKKLAATLRSSLKTIDRTKPTLASGSTALGLLAKNLGRTAVSNAVLPIIDDLRGTYVNEMEGEVEALADRLEGVYPGKSRNAATVALAKVLLATEKASTNANRTLALRSLSTAAKALALAQKSVGKAEVAKPGANFLTATITETGFAPVTFTATKFFVEATYDSFSGDLFIDGAALKRLAGRRAEIRTVSLQAVVAASGSYTLGLTNDANGWFGHGIYTADEETEYEETYFSVDPINMKVGTGTMSLHLDLAANLVWGTYEFTAEGSQDTARSATVKGSFLVRLTEPDFEPEL